MSIKIKIECWWSKTKDINNRFLKQFVNNEDRQSFKFVEKNPDFTIVFGKTKWEEIETKPNNTFFFSQEPLWSKNEDRERVHNFCNHIFVNDKRLYPNSGKYIETTVPMLYGSSGEYHNDLEYSWDINIKEFDYQKNKNISVVCSNGIYHLGELEKDGFYSMKYKYRTDFVRNISKNTSIDVYGKRWEKNNSNIKGQIWNKHLGLNDYRFSVALENTVQKNYISEKFWDVVLTNGVPVYYGCNNILDYIDNDYFIYLNNLSEGDKLDLIKELNMNGEEIYKKYENKIKELKNIFFNDDKFNIWNKFKKYIGQ